MLDHDKAEVFFQEQTSVNGNVGIITLNRPQSLNALTLKMCIEIEGMLSEWQKDPAVKAVFIRGEGERAFCAGGDIRSVYENGKSGYKKSRKFFQNEYRMNRRIFHFNKPYISLLHGITMGGGVGLSVHGTHRVAAEDLTFAMPETSIGFFPDVGCTYVLPRCTGKMGFFAGLVGPKLSVADAIYIGVVDHVVPRENFDDLIQAVADAKFSDEVNVLVSDIINEFAMDVEDPLFDKPKLVEHRAEINHCFAQETIEDILVELNSYNTDWAKEVILKLRHKSPTSLKVTLKALRDGSKQNFDECMQMEFRVAEHFLRYPDFYEGIRAAIINKDSSPEWRPDSLEDVDDEMVEEFFEKASAVLEFN